MKLDIHSSCIAVVVYRPGSSPVTAAFAELADVPDRLSTFADSVVLAGDVNIRLERTTDPHAIELCDLVASYGLVQRARGCTHDAGGTLDVVCTRDDLPPHRQHHRHRALRPSSTVLASMSTASAASLRHNDAQIVEVV